MSNDAGKKWGGLTVENGGTPSRKADLELERAARALFVAMCGKDGKSINKNFRNVARGHTNPLRVVVRRFKEAKLARAPKAYDHSKAVVKALDRYVDALHGMRITGEYPPAA